MSWFCCCQKKDEREHEKDNIIDCPRCHRPMIKKSSMGVTIDKCERCNGIWLDRGEIENIISKLEMKQKSHKDKKINTNKKIRR